MMTALALCLKMRWNEVVFEMTEQKKKEIVIEGELNEIKEIAAVLLITQVLEFLNKKSDKKMLIKRNRDDVNGNK